MNTKSTTYWVTLCILFLNPVAWILQFIFNHITMSYLVDSEVPLEEVIQYLMNLKINLPLATLATTGLTAVGLYIAGNKTKAVTMNLGMPKGEGLKEDDSDTESVH